MGRRPQKFAATGFVSALVLATAAFGAPGDALTNETRKADMHAAAGAPGRGVVEIQARAANVRAGPAADAPVITKVTRGCLLPALARSGDWVRVGLGGQAGWVHRTLVEATAAAAAAGAPGREVVEIQARAANVRAGPAADTPVIRVMAAGCRLPALARSGDWVRVELDGGQAGWVHRRLVALAGAREAQVEVTSVRQGARRARTSALSTPEPPRAQTSGPGTSTVAPEVRPAAPTAATLKPEPPHPSPIAPAPVRSQERSGARFEIPVTTTIGLRELPTRPASVVGRPGRGGEATDLGRQGRRIEVTAESPGSPDGGQSWVHQSRTQSVARATTTARVEAMTTPPAAASSPQEMVGGGAVEVRAEEPMSGNEKLHRFETTVERVNERVRRAVGTDVFARIEHPGDGVIELTATQTWVAAPEYARRANLETLSRFWASMHEPDAPVVVRIVSDDGEVMMERRGGGEPAALSGAGS